MREQLPAGRPIASRSRVDRVGPGERAPGPGIAAEQVATDVHGIHLLDGIAETGRVVRRPEVERDAEEVEPGLACGVADGVERLAKLRI